MVDDPIRRKRALVSHILRLRQTGQLSDSECLIWSDLILRMRLPRPRGRKHLKAETYLLRHTRRGWQLIRLTGAHPRVRLPKDQQRASHRLVKSLLLFCDPSGDNIQSTLVTPRVASDCTPERTSLPHQVESRFLYVVRCARCGWQADGVRRLERCKTRHTAKCGSDEYAVAPYMPIRILVPRPTSPGDQPNPPQNRKGTPRNRKGKRKGVVGYSTFRGALVAVGPKFRRNLNVPEVYPDEN